MFKKALKYLVTIIILVLVGYNSVYFKKLDEVKAATLSKQFDPVSYARNYLDKKLIPGLSRAFELTQLVSLIRSDPQMAFKRYSHALGIGNIRFFLVKGEGEIKSINENDVSVVIRSDSSDHVARIATEFVFGNAIRDASGLIDINEFNNTMDFNNVSAEINKIIRTQVLPPFKAMAKKGDIVEFVGAIELNQEHPDVQNIEVIPVTLKIVRRLSPL